MSELPTRTASMMVLGAVLLGVGLFGAGCSSPSSSAAATAARSNGSTVAVVAGENEYGDVASPDRRPVRERLLGRLEPQHRSPHL